MCWLFGHKGKGLTNGYFTCVRCKKLIKVFEMIRSSES